ncbi:MAG: Crp/Fnr family transcriptional regulator [Bacteroidetes bacterium]|nr:MAG: Crp/Fnr family transcriptional regulator [Bacteroidota bacterium]
MNDGFIEAFKRFSFLKLSDLLDLYRLSSLKSFEKGEVIAREGEYCEDAFLIRKGIIRTFVITPEGNERTIRLAKEKDFTSCGASFLFGDPSTEYLEALEDCKVIAVNTKKLEQLSQQNQRVLRLSIEGIKEAFAEAIGRIEFFTVLNPEQRYKKLISESPDLIQRVPQKFLASYLGITTVSLSRIRNRKNSE